MINSLPQVYATLIVRRHIAVPGETDSLARSLLQLCAHHVEVLPLSSGRSGSVSGEVIILNLSEFMHT